MIMATHPRENISTRQNSVCLSVDNPEQMSIVMAAARRAVMVGVNADIPLLQVPVGDAGDLAWKSVLYSLPGIDPYDLRSERIVRDAVVQLVCEGYREKMIGILFQSRRK
jgi:hypothetical protein